MGEAFDRLTDKHKAFAEAYLRTFNATRAAKEAGYSEDTAYSQGSRLLKHVEVKAAVAELLDAKGITAERIKIALAEIAFEGDVAELEAYLVGGLSLVELRASGVNTQLVKSAKTRTRTVTSKNGNDYTTETRQIEMYSRMDALEKLGKVLAMFTDNMDLTSKGKAIKPGWADLPDELLDKVNKELGGPE